MTSTELKAELVRQLDAHIPFRECVYVDWPNYPNPGDHAIATAGLLYLARRKITIHSITSRGKNRFGGLPIIAQGGGNLGDLFPHHEEFRRQLIARNHASPIVVMPQSICFRSAENARRSAEIYNAHPDLTILVREQVSLEIATEIFPACRVQLCPDTAWYLADLIQELRTHQLPQQACLARPQDHLACGGFSGPGWDETLWKLSAEISHPEFLRSLAITMGALWQLSRCHQLTTNRLHAHLLANMLGIPSTLIPVKYHKNSSTDETWIRRVKKTATPSTG